MRGAYVACVLLLAAAPLGAAPPMSPPVSLAGGPVAVENPVPADSYAEVRCALDKGDSIQWEVSPEPKKLTSYVENGGAVLIFNGPSGSYTVTAFVLNFDAKTFDRKKLVVTIGKPAPAPPKPDGPPAPGPTPDPIPSPELKRKILDAYATDRGAKADAVQLAALYREAAKLAQKRTGDKFDAPSSKELLRRVREASANLIGPDVLTAVRTVAAVELADQLGMPTDDPLTDVQRRAAADCYLRLAAALDAIP